MITPFVSMRKARARRLQAIRDREARIDHLISDLTENASWGAAWDHASSYRRSPASKAKKLLAVEAMGTRVAPVPGGSRGGAGNERQPAWMREVQQILLDPGAGQLVPGRSRRTANATGAFRMAPKVPFGDRVNPYIRPTDDQFQLILTYFQSLLRRDHLTIDQILESNFDEHEISLLVLASGPPEVIQWQKDNSIHYQRLLQTVFKGETPSVHLKMAMLYFGLPVAPLKMGQIQTVQHMDLDFLEDEVVYECEPLKFLDDYTERCYGDPLQRARAIDFVKPLPTQKFTSLSMPPRERMSLRGGSLEFDYLSGEYYEALGKAAVVADDSPRPFLLLGYQGMVTCLPDYRDFVRAVDKLLNHQRPGSDYLACADFYEVDRKTGAAKITSVARAEARIYHNKTPDDCPIFTKMQGYVQTGADAPSTQPVAVFLHYPKDDHPSAPEPLGAETKGVLKFACGSNLAYMKVPDTLSDIYKPSQYSGDYHDIMGFLHPDKPQQYFSFSVLGDTGEPNDVKGSTFGIRDPPPALWDEVIKVSKTMKTQQLPIVDMSAVTEAEADTIHIIVPGFYQGTDKQRRIPRGYLTDASSDPKSLNMLLAAIFDVNPNLKKHEGLTHLAVHTPAERPLTRASRGDQIFVERFDVGIASGHWRSIAEKVARKNPGPCGSLLVRPIFQEYWAHADGNAILVPDPHLVRPIEFFDWVLPRLFPGKGLRVDDFEKRCLYIRQTTWGLSEVSAVLRYQTSETEWSWFARHVTEPDMTISIEDWDNIWTPSGDNVNCLGMDRVPESFSENKPWGPRYNRRDVPLLTTFFDSDDETTIPPKGAQPGGTQPGGTQPGGTQPGGTQPSGTPPGSTQPGGTQPSSTQPGGTQPDSTKPGETQPGGTQPGGPRPPGPRPGGAPPRDPRPGGAPPRGPRPGGTQPGGTQPGSTQPGGTQSGGQDRRIAKPRSLNPLAEFTSTFGKTGNAQTTAERATALRRRFFYTTPSVFTDPTKPSMPIHGPPLESVLRTGPYTPGMTVAMRTPTEVARLEREVHSLRNQILERARECPYFGCHVGPFRFDDRAGLDQHMKNEHNVLRCFLCTDKETLLPLDDADAIREHLLKYHAKDLKKVVCNDEQNEKKGKKTRPDQENLEDVVGTDALKTINQNKKTLFHYCDRCGRDQSQLDNPADQRYHDQVCTTLTTMEERINKVARTPYCQLCGQARVRKPQSRDLEPCKCGQTKQDEFDPGNVCPSCGLVYGSDGTPMARYYREIHMRLCKRPSGRQWDYCGFCGVSLESVGDMLKRQHVHWCEQRPRKGPVTCPLCDEQLVDGNQATAHMDAAHDSRNIQTCPFCGDSLENATPDEREIHLGYHLYSNSYIPTAGDDQQQPPVDPAKVPNNVEDLRKRRTKDQDMLAELQRKREEHLARLANERKSAEERRNAEKTGEQKDQEASKRAEEERIRREGEDEAARKAEEERRRLEILKSVEEAREARERREALRRAEEERKTGEEEEGAGKTEQEKKDDEMLKTIRKRLKNFNEELEKRAKEALEEAAKTAQDDSSIPEEQIWRRAKDGEATPGAREPSPDWGPEEPDYTPPFTARCSRCFRGAGDLEWINKHMDPNGACKIRRGRSNATSESQLPNRSGWIEYPNSIDFTKAFRDFTTKYPAYRHTMFPMQNDLGQVEEIYDQEYEEETVYGYHYDDPNNGYIDSLYTTTESRLLPWPPVPGRVIPIPGEPKNSEKRKSPAEDSAPEPGPSPKRPRRSGRKTTTGEDETDPKGKPGPRSKGKSKTKDSETSPPPLSATFAGPNVLFRGTWIPAGAAERIKRLEKRAKAKEGAKGAKGAPAATDASSSAGKGRKGAAGKSGASKKKTAAPKPKATRKEKVNKIFAGEDVNIDDMWDDESLHEL